MKGLKRKLKSTSLITHHSSFIFYSLIKQGIKRGKLGSWEDRKMGKRLKPGS
jgi:hypothetical protein